MRIGTWLSDSLQRQFPLADPPAERPLRLIAARGERISFQVCMRMTGGAPVEIRVDVANVSTVFGVVSAGPAKVPGS